MSPETNRLNPTPFREFPKSKLLPITHPKLYARYLASCSAESHLIVRRHLTHPLTLHQIQRSR